MSSIWTPNRPDEAQPLGGWGTFGSIAPKGRFSSRFGAQGDGTGWSAARSQTPDYLESEPEPQEDPVERASQEGFIAGFQEGDRMAREEMATDNAARMALADAIAQLSGKGEGALAQLLSEAVLRLVTQIVGEVAVDENMLAQRCVAVAALIDPDDGKATLEVNPQDMALIDAESVGCALVPNAALSRGSVRLATAEGWVEDGPDVQLDRLRALMNDMEGRA